MRPILSLCVLAVSACTSDQLGRLDFRTLDAERFAVVFLNGAGQVVSVTRTVALDEAPAVQFTVPDDASSTAVISWNDADFAAANRCLTPVTVPVIEAAAPPELIYPTSGPRVQSLDLALPDSFAVQQADFTDRPMLFDELVMVDNSAISTQVSLRAEMDTEDPPLPYAPFEEIEATHFGGVSQLRWLDEQRVLILGGNALTLYDPLTAAVVARIDLNRGQINLRYEDFEISEAQDGLRIVVVGSAEELPNIPRPTSYVAFVRLRDDELDFISDATGQLGGLKSVVMTSSTTFLTVGYKRSADEGLNLFRGLWGTADLEVVALLRDTMRPEADAAAKIALAPDGIYVSTTRQLHYGTPGNLSVSAIDSVGNEAIRVFNIVQAGRIAYGVGNLGHVVRRVGFNPPEAITTERFVIPPSASASACITPTDGRLKIARQDLEFNDWDGESLSLLLKRCGLALVMDPVTECGRVINARTPPVLEVRDGTQDFFRRLLVGPRGAFFTTSFGRVWFAARL